MVKKMPSKHGIDTYSLRIRAALCLLFFTPPADLTPSIYLNSPLTHKAIVCIAGCSLQLNVKLDCENHQTSVYFQTRIDS